MVLRKDNPRQKYWGKYRGTEEVFVGYDKTKFIFKTLKKTAIEQLVITIIKKNWKADMEIF